MRVLVTGGAGFIGSHTLVELVAAGHEPFVLDNFDNSSPKALGRVAQLIQRDVNLTECDIRDRDQVKAAFDTIQPDAVVHFAGLKAVGESEERPTDYYDVNVSGTLSLLAAMDAVGCRQIVFSSSATVYGPPEYLPYDENHPLNPVSVYARTKLMAENILTDWQRGAGDRRAVILRYFNPVGAHESGMIGEDPDGIPNNLMPFISQVAVGRRPALTVHGNDYETPDGTGIRDYIHVVDLARAHVAALALDQTAEQTVLNIGTGRGYSVLDMVTAFEAASGRTIPYVIGPRREGDIAEMQANVDRAAKVLGWRATHDLSDMCGSAWHWQSDNPAGYETS